jgi:hypothetical protein
MHDHRSSLTPFALAGLLLAVLLIFVSTRHQASSSTPLQAVFAAQATQIDQGQGPGVPAIPAGATDAAGAAAVAAADAIATASEAAKGWGLPIPNPFGPKVIASGQTPRLRVEIFALEPADGEVKVVGEVRNISAEKLTVPISVFLLRDATGNEYAAGGSAKAELEPGASTPLELTVPVPPGKALTLTVELPPDAPVVIVLQSYAPP